MTEPSSRIFANPTSGTYAILIETAWRIVTGEGLARLSLRNLAEEAGVSTTVVTHHLGAKDEILPKLIEAAKCEDEAFFAPWREMTSRLASPSHVLAARAYSSWFGDANGRAVLLSEVLQTRHLAPAGRRALADWIALHEAAWGEIGGAGRGHVISRMLVDEAAFSPALGSSPSYCLLRDLCLARLFHRGDTQTFETVRDALAPKVSLVVSPPDLDDARSRIAEAAAILVTEDGAHTLNHRRVAERAGVAASSVVYHFGGRDELMLAALIAVLAGFRKWVRGVTTAPADGGPKEAPDIMRITERLVRATHAIGLGALRYDTLLPHAVDMRRRRGENVRPEQIQGLNAPEWHLADPLFCQVLSVASFGARMLAMALDEDQETAHGRVAQDLIAVI